MRELDNEMLLLAKGNMSSLATIYALTKNAVFSVVLSICKDSCQAEDLMQETYLKVMENINRYTPGTNPKAWICTIARNLAINDFNKKKRESLIDHEENAAMFGTYTDNVGEKETIEAVIKNLREEEAEIVLLHTVGGFKHREIALIVQKPVATVRWSYRNALGKLQKVFEKEGLR